MRDYELTLILKPDLGEEGVTATTDRVAHWLDLGGGEVVKTVNAGRKRLAYQINHSRDGNYVVMDVRARPEALDEVERNLKLATDVLRYMLLRR